MLEEVKRVTYRRGDPHREVAPVTPYPRIDPQQDRHEGYPGQQPRKHEQPAPARRRFTAMRELIEKLRSSEDISRVDFNTVNQELLDIGLALAEAELISLLLQLKVPLDSIDDIVRQLQHRSETPNFVSGLDMTSETNMFPVFVEELAEYLMCFESVLVKVGKQNQLLVDEITNHGRYQINHGRIKLDFSRPADESALDWDKLNLVISVKVGAVEVDENGRRAIFYQRPESKGYGLYSDKSLSLSI
ncbi:hypothetical protein SAMN02745165_02295 [Malonomonas rubra DSM 5091]|uniref:Uncharacterized protein n=1 Tax=Malonomonas rubra DSM 5091 TaxID=1122189 RepID=A0A1M6IYP5_MALRU|nr:hypothetical protein [Malonomonas rubra]SHJ39543.1 hypothetical protein SAMN02745165_02295 [Malonomonas rubra DSM 5091]